MIKLKLKYHYWLISSILLWLIIGGLTSLSLAAQNQNPGIGQVSWEQLHGDYEEVPHRYRLSVEAWDLDQHYPLTYSWLINCGYFVGGTNDSFVEWWYDIPGECIEAMATVEVIDSEGARTARKEYIFVGTGEPIDYVEFPSFIEETPEQPEDVIEISAEEPADSIDQSQDITPQLSTAEREELLQEIEALRQEIDNIKLEELEDELPEELTPEELEQILKELSQELGSGIAPTAGEKLTDEEISWPSGRLGEVLEPGEPETTSLFVEWLEPVVRRRSLFLFSLFLLFMLGFLGWRKIRPNKKFKLTPAEAEIIKDLCGESRRIYQDYLKAQRRWRKMQENLDDLRKEAEEAQEACKKARRAYKKAGEEKEASAQESKKISDAEIRSKILKDAEQAFAVGRKAGDQGAAQKYDQVMKDVGRLVKEERQRMVDGGKGLKEAQEAAKKREQSACEQAQQAQAKYEQAREQLDKSKAQEEYQTATQAWARQQAEKAQCLEAVDDLKYKIKEFRGAYADCQSDREQQLEDLKKRLDQASEEIKKLAEEWENSFKQFREIFKKIMNLKRVSGAESVEKEVAGLWDWGGIVGTIVGLLVEDQAKVIISTDFIKGVQGAWNILAKMIDPHTLIGQQIMRESGLSEEEIEEVTQAVNGAFAAMIQALQSYDQHLIPLARLGYKLKDLIDKFAGCVAGLPPVPKEPQYDLGQCLAGCLDLKEELTKAYERLKELNEQCQACQTGEIKKTLAEMEGLKENIKKGISAMNEAKANLEKFRRALKKYFKDRLNL